MTNSASPYPFEWNFLESTLRAHAPSAARFSGEQKDSGVQLITTDSRKAKEGSLFVAIPGEKFDGHAFIETALTQGATAILCKHGTEIPPAFHKKARFFEVADTEAAYRALGKEWRSQLKAMPVLVVAGSVGKTTTKELLSALLEGKFPGRVLKTTGSQNGFLGIPMTLLEIRPELHSVAVIEVGIDEPHTMIRHMDIVRGTHSLLTAIGPEHLEKLIDLPTVAREEAIALEETIRMGGRALVNLDDPWIAPLAEKLPKSQIQTYSLLGKADIRGSFTSSGALEVKAKEGIPFTLPCPLPGEHHARNLLAAAAVALDIGFTPEEIERGLAGFKGAAGRTEVRELTDGTRVIADHYNANPSSMHAAFGILKATSTAPTGLRIACLADMLELGAEEERWHRELAEPLMAALPAGVLLYGPRMKWLLDELKSRHYSGVLCHFQTHEELAQELSRLVRKGSVVLVKGSRGMKMENVLSAWVPADRAKILQPNAAAFKEAAALLQSGQVVGMPTETVYGLAGNALDEKALTRIFSTKERPTFDPLIVHITPALLDRALPDGSTLDALDTLGIIQVDLLSDLARSTLETLANEFWPGPLTLVLPRGPRIPDLVSSGLPTVALRMPAHPVAQDLINTAGLPLAAPSANRFGRISPTSAHAVDQELGDRIPLILDGGDCDIGVESTVLSVTDSGEPVLLRPGGISVERISETLNAEILSPSAVAAESAPQPAPGMLASHYAPKKPLTLLPQPLATLSPGTLEQLTEGKRFGILLQNGNAINTLQKLRSVFSTLSAVETLTETGDRGEAARNLFRKLRELDASDAEILFAEPVVSREGLDHAIADRLRRAATPRG